jgi:TM2 domain-containing membrane protein YozV
MKKKITNILFVYYILLSQINCNLFCDNSICDEIGGFCIDDNICECKEGYTTLSTAHNFKLCNYERKKAIKIAFLELFIGFGIGHFYTARYINGSIKLIIYSLLCCCCYCSIAIAYKLTQENQEGFNTMVTSFLKAYGIITNLLIVWQIIDFILFITGGYTDGNNISLY